MCRLRACRLAVGADCSSVSALGSEPRCLSTTFCFLCPSLACEAVASGMRWAHPKCRARVSPAGGLRPICEGCRQSSPLGSAQAPPAPLDPAAGQSRCSSPRVPSVPLHPSQECAVMSCVVSFCSNSDAEESHPVPAASCFSVCVCMHTHVHTCECVQLKHPDARRSHV